MHARVACLYCMKLSYWRARARAWSPSSLHELSSWSSYLTDCTYSITGPIQSVHLFEIRVCVFLRKAALCIWNLHRVSLSFFFSVMQHFAFGILYNSYVIQNARKKTGKGPVLRLRQDVYCSTGDCVYIFNLSVPCVHGFHNIRQAGSNGRSPLICQSRESTRYPRLEFTYWKETWEMNLIRLHHITFVESLYDSNARKYGMHTGTSKR
jgi:hypothetical protein